MGTTAEKLSYLGETKNQLKDVINYAGAEITTDTFRQYPRKLYASYLDILKDDGESLFNNLPHVTGQGTNITLNNTAETRMKMELNPSELEQELTPTPSNPQDVHVITGDNTIKVVNKNLAWTGWAEDFVARINNSTLASMQTFDNKNCIKFNARAGNEDYDTKYMFKTNWKGNTQYTFSLDLYADNNSGSSNVCIGYTDGSVTILDATANSWTHINVTSTNGKTIKYLRARWSSGNSYINLNTFVVVEGTIAAENVSHQEQNYPITLGNQEYCKIGDYKDEFYKATASDTSLQEGKWYLKKNIGKVVLNGSEDWDHYSVTQGDLFRTTRITDDTTDNTYTPYSNYFIGLANIVSSQREDGKFYLNVSNNTTDFIDNRFTSANGFKNWLLNNNVVVYYVLATPTYTLLNDTLQTELDNISYVLSYDGQTNIGQTNDDLPFVMKATSIKNYDSTLN